MDITRGGGQGTDGLQIAAERPQLDIAATGTDAFLGQAQGGARNRRNAGVVAETSVALAVQGRQIQRIPVPNACAGPGRGQFDLAREIVICAEQVDVARASQQLRGSTLQGTGLTGSVTHLGGLADSVGN